MKLNIGDFKTSVMLEQVNGSIARLNTLTGLYLTNRLLFVAMAYVGIIAYFQEPNTYVFPSRVWKKCARVCRPPSNLVQGRTNSES